MRLTAFMPSKLVAACLLACALAAGPARGLDVVAPEATNGAASGKLREGRDALAAHKLDAAQAAFTEAARLAPKDPRPWVGRSAAAQLRGRAAEAREHMARAVALAPDHPRVLHIQGQLLLDQQDHPAAEAVFRKILGLAPKQIESQIGLANALSGQGKAVPARELLAQATKAASAAADWLLLGNAQLAAGDADAALMAFNKVPAGQDAAVAAQAGKAEALERLGRPEMALAALQRAIEAAPTQADLQIRRGLLYEQLKRPDSAEAAYREAIRLDEKSAAAHNNLAYLLGSQGIKLDEALSHAKRALLLDPAAAMFDTLGSVHLARRDYPAARSALEQAVAKAPERDVYRQRLAQAQAQGKGAEAVAAALASAPPATVAARPAKAMPEASSNSAGVKSVASITATAAQPVVPLGAAPASAAVAATAAANAGTTAPANAANAATLQGTAASDARAAVASRLQAWESAWEAKDAGRYLDVYAADFKPEKHRNRDEWVADRRKKLDKPGSIQIDLDAPNFEVAGDVVKVTFTQRYNSSNYKDATRKQLEWVKESGEWRIRRETTL